MRFVCALFKIFASGFGFDGSKILLSEFGSGHPGYLISERISDRIRIPVNNLRPTTDHELLFIYNQDRTRPTGG